MDIQRATLTPFRLHMQLPLQTAHGTTRVRDGVLLQLDTPEGSGFGETMPLPGFGLESLQQASDRLRDTAQELCRGPIDGLPQALEIARRGTRDSPGAAAALETALCDLTARQQGLPLTALLGGTARQHVEVGTLIAAKTPREVGAAAREAVRAGFRTLKLKVAATTLERDLARVAGARDAIGDDVALRLDANGGWDEATAREALTRLEPARPEYVEQPLPAQDLEGLARLRGTTKVPIAADESAGSLAGAQAVITGEAADLLIVKPAVLGGPRSALRVAQRALAAGIEPVVTGFLDSAIGDAAALQLAAALGGRAAGLATLHFFQADLAPCSPPVDGQRALPSAPGLGIAPEPACLERATAGSPRRIERC